MLSTLYAIACLSAYPSHGWIIQKTGVSFIKKF